MKKNMGFIDRAVRVIITLVLVTLFLTNVLSGFWGIVLMVVAVIMFLTSLASFCLVYLPLGLNTLRKKVVPGDQPNNK